MPRPVKLAYFRASKFSGTLTGRAQMPVYRHSKRLLKTSPAATKHQAGGWIVLPRHSIIEIELRILPHSPAKIRADEPAVKLRGFGASGGKTVVQCIPAVDGSRPGARELIVRRAGNSIARRPQ